MANLRVLKDQGYSPTVEGLQALASELLAHAHETAYLGAMSLTKTSSVSFEQLQALAALSYSGGLLTSALSLLLCWTETNVSENGPKMLRSLPRSGNGFAICTTVLDSVEVTLASLKAFTASL